MKAKIFTRIKRVCAWLFALAFILPFFCFGWGRYALNTFSASAASGDYIAIKQYKAEMTVGENRRIAVKESITVEFLRAGLTMFYRSLPTDGARYSQITASCAGNEAFTYHVADNPDDDGFIDINCVGNAALGNVWTYELSYTMEQGVDTNPDGMIIDVVGFGWTVPLHDVSVTVYLPTTPTEYQIYTDIFGSGTQNEATCQLSADGKTLHIYADILNCGYSQKYDEYVTGGITLQFTLPKGVLDGYAATRIFTEDIWKIVLGALGAVALAFGVFTLTHKKRALITVVNIKAPDEMDPMKMGKWLDGAVNDEDITSMIYYFANKGYLRIDFSNEDDPKLIACVQALPNTEPEYQRTLFAGLFAKADTELFEDPFEEGLIGKRKVTFVSKAAGKFYDAMQKARMQVPAPPTMYEMKSIFGYILGPIIGAGLGILTCLLMSMRVGGSYAYGLGVVFLLPLLVMAILGYISENYRYKWKRAMRTGMLAVEVGIAVLFSLLVIFLLARFLMTEWEKLVLCLGVFGSYFCTRGTLSRTEEYAKVLENILGFKEFIVVTEEDKIAFMLKENPELYYKVLPYAQVLGVTDEWEHKFQKLTMEPPAWYYGTAYTHYHYYYLHRSLDRAMSREIAAEIARRSKNSGGGGRVGRSGGGGSFGSFGGGGFGGGGGGAR